MAFNSSAELTDHHRRGSLPHNSIEHCLKPRLIDYYMGLYYPIVWGFMVSSQELHMCYTSAKPKIENKTHLPNFVIWGEGNHY